MNQTRTLSFIASLLMAALGMALPGSAAAQSAQDFQLPPNPSATPTEPQVQGPVDEEIRAPASPTATPTTAPAPQNTPTVQPTRAPQLEVTPTPARTSAAPRPRPTATTPNRPGPLQTADTVETPAAVPATDTETPAEPADTVATATSQPSVPIETSAAENISETESGFPWTWLAALAALIAAIGAFLFWRRQQAAAPPATIEPPKVAKTPAPAAQPASDSPPATTPVPPASSHADWLKIEARVSELQRSMMNTTLRYKLKIANRSGSVLENVEIEADLATAHNGLPVTEQLASPETPLTVRETIARLAPGERTEIEGEIMIPLSSVKIITQGKALLCVPLLRMRATHEASGKAPLARTWVVGRITPETRGKLNPFRFDAPPQTYGDIGARSLD